MENKREKFVRLANLRVNNATKYISLVGNLSNKNNYAYSNEDVAKIYKELEKSLRVSKAKFMKNKKGNFKL